MGSWLSSESSQRDTNNFGKNSLDEISSQIMQNKMRTSTSNSRPTSYLSSNIYNTPSGNTYSSVNHDRNYVGYGSKSDPFKIRDSASYSRPSSNLSSNRYNTSSGNTYFSSVNHDRSSSDTFSFRNYNRSNTESKHQSNYTKKPFNSYNEGNGRSNQNRKQLSKPMMRILKLIFQNDFSNDKDLAYLYLKQLESNIRLLQKTDINYSRILTYVQNTHGPTHSFKLSVEEIYVGCRKGALKDFKEYKKLGNRKFLWHGTPLSNYASILSRGLSIEPPPDVRVTGKMFGDGIYFADVVTKAAQYCKATEFEPYGILILAQVALGKEYVLTRSEKVISLPSGFNSVKGVGRYQHKIKQNIKTEYKVEIPLGALELNRNVNTALDYNEYIVYNNDQVFVEYLVLVKFDF